LNGLLLIGGTLLAGLIVPLAMQFRAGFQGVKTSVNVTLVTSLLILVGGFIMRTVIVMAPQGLM
jgi:formate-dependent nitrite reductase membrane component NrfD